MGDSAKELYRLRARVSEWTLRHILTPARTATPAVKAARLIRVGLGFLAAACLYHSLILVSSGGERRWLYTAILAVMLLELRTEALLIPLLPEREFPFADRIFEGLPVFFLMTLAVETIAGVTALRSASSSALVLVAVATVFVCVCPPEFRRFRYLTCTAAAIIALASSPGLLIGVPQNATAGAAFYALGSAGLSGPIRRRLDPAQPENVPPRPMQ